MLGANRMPFIKDLILCHYGACCHNPSLGLMTKARACKGMSQEGSLWVTFHTLGSVGECEGMNPHISKYTPILGIVVLMDSQIFREQSQRSKPIGLNSSLYHWKNLLECKCLKWARMTHLDTSNTSYGQKKSPKSNWQFDPWPLKINNRPNFLTCRWCTVYRYKLSTRATILLQASYQSKIYT
jgi:hypothetical protein